MTEIEKLLAEAEAALEGVTEGDWASDNWKVEAYRGTDADGADYWQAVANCERADDAAFIAWARNNVPALIAALRAMQAERDDMALIARKANEHLASVKAARDAAEAKLAEVEKERDAIASLPEQGVRVRALEWRFWSEGEKAGATAQSIFGEYRIVSFPQNNDHRLFIPTNGDVIRGDYTDLKPAAQADYDRRILAALSPAEAGGVAHMGTLPETGTGKMVVPPQPFTTQNAEAGINDLSWPAQIARIRAEYDAMVKAAEAMLASVCGPVGFVEAARHNTGLALPWPSLDIAETNLRAALAAIREGRG